jgi:glycosyltransferase involved in cell wall biosynthesis
LKLVIVTNIPAPYRLPIYERLNNKYKNNFLVIYCSEKESNRKWNLDEFKFNHIFLKKNVKAKKDGFNFIHNNPDVFLKLKNYNPDIIITTGFNPTHLYAWIYAKLFRKKHICMTDGWIYSESSLSTMHKIIRKIIFQSSSAFIGASKNSLDLYRSYGISDEKLFQSHLCINNEHFKNNKQFEDREYDLMFSGQFTERKLPIFFAEIVQKVLKKIPNIKVLILGDGPLKEEFFLVLDNANINYYYAGFVKQEELPKYYSSSKLFLFTTRLDPWGVVVNEAMASGTPVLTTPYTGVVNDLLIDKKNGFILPIDSKIWSKKVLEVLNNPELWNSLSKASKERVEDFNFDVAAKGIIDASEFAYAK